MTPLLHDHGAMFIATSPAPWQPLGMRITPALFAPLVMLSLSGCLAKTVLDVATAPVRVASKTVDWATTSQSESDEKRGREIRRREEQLGKLQRSYEKSRRQCEDGNRAACDLARSQYEQMGNLTPTVPYEPRRR
jgi:hypothetical protein